MTKISKLSNLKLTTIISFLIVVVSALAFLPLKVDTFGEITFGILLGGGCSTLAFFLYAATEHIKGDKGAIITVILIVVSSLLHIAAILISVLLYFKANIHTFNIVATVVSLFIGLIVFAIVNLVRKGKD